MPELPEVQTVVNTLNALLVSPARIHRVDHVRADMLKPAGCDLAGFLRGRAIVDVSRRGKRIIFRFDDSNRIYIHLGMTGRLTIEPRRAPVRAHTHLIVSLSGGRQIRLVDPRRFGAIAWMGPGPDDGAMGPEPMDIRPADFVTRLQSTRRAIKTALLDQRLIAGIGNIYADEALFAARVPPTVPARDLSRDRAAKLCAAIKRVLRRAIDHRGSTLRDYIDANGQRGGFQALHRVYDRQGQPCPRCQTPIARIVLGGRSTHFCPQCQATKG